MKLFFALFVAFYTLSATAASVLVWEAENAQSVEKPMILVGAATGTVSAVKGASGDLYLDIPEKSGNPPKVTTGKAVYEVDVPADGSYVLWARVYWEGECSNSFSVKVGSANAFAFGQDATYKRWHWVRSPRRLKVMNLKKGKVTLEFQNREDGVRIDQIAISSNTRWVPVDIEKLRPEND